MSDTPNAGGINDGAFDDLEGYNAENPHVVFVPEIKPDEFLPSHVTAPGGQRLFNEESGSPYAAVNKKQLDQARMIEESIPVDLALTEVSLVTQQTSKALSLAEVAHHVAQETACTRGMAELAVTHFGQDVLEGVKLESFTHRPSKTNHKLLIQSTRRRTAIESAQIQAKVVNIYTNLLQAARVSLQNIKDNHSHALEMAAAFAAEHPYVDANRLPRRHFDHIKAGRFDMMAKQFHEVEFEKVNASELHTPEARILHSNLTEMLSWPHVKAIVYTLKTAPSRDNLRTNLKMAKEFTFTVGDFITILTQGSWVALFETVSSTIDELLGSIDALTAQFEVDKDKEDLSVEKLKNLQSLDAVLHEAKEMAATYYYSSRLLEFAAPYIALLLKLTR